MASWQSEITSVSNSLKHILEFRDFSDVTFSFGEFSNEKKVKAHKLILAMRSDVFQAMFYGTMREERSDVLVTDIDEHIFQIMLKYIYTDQFEAKLPEDIISTFYAAHKYHIPSLMNLCRTQIVPKLTGNNVSKIFQVARLLEDEILITKCENIIPQNSKTVLESESFANLSGDVVEYLIRQKKLNTASESDIFRAVLVWAKRRIEGNKKYIEEKSETNEKEKDISENIKEKNMRKEIRSVMNFLLPYINFLSMNLEEFIKLPDLTVVFSKKEIVQMALNIAKIRNVPLPDWFGTGPPSQK
ncbi:BTB/POZ domain-containing protein 6-B-like [Centruroides sculpturatus]|uniref:BTB/POZ domain-containing protein 6-B-like n=1 Tax=Centruroides sculpturatus TaxID=218467 RepID=UPI000C6D5623|nr:BTB/POZ domain-containing protein 6-B-like [Centruroides sculpturatus]